MIRKKWTEASGYTAIEVLVSIGLMGALLTAIAMVSADTFKNVRQTRLSMTRDQIVNQIRTTTTNTRAILKAMKLAENQAFTDCICGKNTCSHMQKSASGDFLPFTLVDAAGTVLSPAFFDDDGVPCDSKNLQCALRVTTTFFAQCKPDLTSTNQNPPLTCNGTPADFVAVMYKVDENPDAAKTQAIHFKPLSGPTYIEVANILKEAGACL